MTAIARRGISGTPNGSWYVVLPAWGDRCVGVLLRSTLPALAAAVGVIARPLVLCVFSDRGAEIEAAASALFDMQRVSVRSRPVPGPDQAFESMSNCHRQVLEEAPPGSRVLLLTADIVVSREVVATCEALISAGRQLVCCVAMRATEGEAPIGASGRDLLAWAWANRHSMTRECTWPDGRSYDVWRMYFEKDGEVAARVFLPHPLAVVSRGRPLAFAPTIDVNLTNNFSGSAIYLITQPEEGAAVELSPPDKDFLLTTTMRARVAAGGPSCPAMVRCTHERHRMFFGKRAVICGSGDDCGDAEMVKKVLG